VLSRATLVQPASRKHACNSRNAGTVVPHHRVVIAASLSAGPVARATTSPRLPTSIPAQCSVITGMVIILVLSAQTSSQRFAFDTLSHGHEAPFLGPFPLARLKIGNCPPVRNSASPSDAAQCHRLTPTVSILMPVGGPAAVLSLKIPFLLQASIFYGRKKLVSANSPPPQFHRTTRTVFDPPYPRNLHIQPNLH